MRVLGVDTSTMAAGIGVSETDRIVGELNTLLPRTHSERLLGGIRTLLDHLAVETGEIDAFAVTLGPGSFTGLRIGIATIQGLALASQRPAVGVSTLEAMASWCGQTWQGWICPVMNAGRREVYTALFRWDGGKVLRVKGEVVSRPEPVFQELAGEGICFVGDGAGTYRDLLVRRAGAHPRDRILGFHPYLGGATALLGCLRLSEHRGIGAGPLSPNYLRRPDAERKRQPES